MKLITSLLFIIAIFGVQNIKAAPALVTKAAGSNLADTTKYGYNKRIQMMAVKDARAFKLPPDQRKDFKKGMLPKSSDYFKPTALYCADPQMLTDSNYVREFREAAFRRAGHKSGFRTIYIVVGVLVLFAALYAGAYEIFGAR
jgi:hypothetical protein